MNVESGKSLTIKPKTINIKKENLKLIVKQIIDFDSFNHNGYDLLSFFIVQKWYSFVDMLNGPTYPHLVRDLWVRAEVYNELTSYMEQNMKVKNDKSLKGKSINEMGLKEFEEVEIR